MLTSFHSSTAMITERLSRFGVWSCPCIGPCTLSPVSCPGRPRAIPAPGGTPARRWMICRAGALGTTGQGVRGVVADLSKIDTPEALDTAGGNQGAQGHRDRMMQVSRDKGISFAKAARRPRALLAGTPHEDRRCQGGLVQGRRLRRLHPAAHRLPGDVRGIQPHGGAGTAAARPLPLDLRGPDPAGESEGSRPADWTTTSGRPNARRARRLNTMKPRGGTKSQCKNSRQPSSYYATTTVFRMHAIV